MTSNETTSVIYANKSNSYNNNNDDVVINNIDDDGLRNPDPDTIKMFVGQIPKVRRLKHKKCF